MNQNLPEWMQTTSFSNKDNKANSIKSRSTSITSKTETKSKSKSKSKIKVYHIKF